jgi:hypothetical protein
MRTWLRDNGLTIALLALFGVSAVGMALSGWRAEVETLAQHGAPPVALGAYLASGGFLSAVFENWESEFLQMWAYVMLTAYLFQRGSPESKAPDEAAPQDADPAAERRKPGAPAPLRAGRLARAVYSHSLGLAMLALFLASFALHWVNSARNAREEAALHGQAGPGRQADLIDPQLWLEYLQNWQSEFLSTAVLIVVAIYLRERGSPESKAVADPHEKTGNS